MMTKYFQIAKKPYISVHVEMNDSGMVSAHLSHSSKEQGFVCHIKGASSLDMEGAVINWLKGYSKGEWKDLPPFEVGDLPTFTQRILHKLKDIPFGKTVSYQQLAESADVAKGARAVGGACGRNPLLLFLPCHRVIRSSGELGGFSEGLDFKKLLLEFEASIK